MYARAACAHFPPAGFCETETEFAFFEASLPQCILCFDRQCVHKVLKKILIAIAGTLQANTKLPCTEAQTPVSSFLLSESVEHKAPLAMLSTPTQGH